MDRRVFFSFHHERDYERATIVRNSSFAVKGQSTELLSGTLWDRAKSKGEVAVEILIDKQLEGTAVTVVLIGAETASQAFVGYEIKASHIRGNGMIGVYIHNIPDRGGHIAAKGRNPFEDWRVQQQGREILLSKVYPTYDWVNDNGTMNMRGWIETAAIRARR